MHGRFYPVLVMEWIQGPTLDVYIDKALLRRDYACELSGLAEGLLAVAKELRDGGVAHGDLQHQNIIVSHEGLRLVDLDGMFVPAIAGLGAVEVGLDGFQRPKRDESLFDSALDGFSVLVIYLSLLALREDPELWQQFHVRDGSPLLFKRVDFEKPAGSKLFRRQGHEGRHRSHRDGLAQHHRRPDGRLLWIVGAQSALVAIGPRRDGDVRRGD